MPLSKDDLQIISEMIESKIEPLYTRLEALEKSSKRFERLHSPEMYEKYGLKKFSNREPSPG